MAAPLAVTEEPSPCRPQGMVQEQGGGSQTGEPVEVRDSCPLKGGWRGKQAPGIFGSATAALAHRRASVHVSQDVSKWLGLVAWGRGSREGRRRCRARSPNNAAPAPRRSIHQSSEQMAQQKGLSKEIAARSLVTCIGEETQEEQTLGGSEIASAREERKPPSLPPPPPVPASGPGSACLFSWGQTGAADSGSPREGGERLWRLPCVSLLHRKPFCP